MACREGRQEEAYTTMLGRRHHPSLLPSPSLPSQSSSPPSQTLCLHSHRPSVNDTTLQTQEQAGEQNGSGSSTSIVVLIDSTVLRIRIDSSRHARILFKFTSLLLYWLAGPAIQTLQAETAHTRRHDRTRLSIIFVHEVRSRQSGAQNRLGSSYWSCQYPTDSLDVPEPLAVPPLTSYHPECICSSSSSISRDSDSYYMRYHCSSREGR
jgi:hypothetical protein